MKVLYILSNEGLDGSFLTWVNFIKEAVKYDVNPYVVCKPQLVLTDYFQSIHKEVGFQYKTMNVYESVKQFPPKSFKGKVHWSIKLIRAVWPKIKFLHNLMKYARVVKPDIIDTNVGTVHEGLWASFFLRIPHVWHLREYQDIGCGYWIYPTKSIYKIVLKCSNVITLTEDLKQYYGLSKSEKVFVIPDGVYHTDEERYEHQKKPYFLCASRIHYQKHIDDAILAFAEISHKYPEYKLLLAGDGGVEYVQEMKLLADQTGVSNRIEFLGFCNKETIKQLMLEAKAVLVPSSYEGFGLMTAESIFNGTLVIGRANGGTCEIIKETGGILYEGEFHELAKAMEKLLELSLTDYEEITKRAMALANNKYAIDINSKRIVDVYKALIR
jgi:glycosyltransferase involved in cell wall biosynthesis